MSDKTPNFVAIVSILGAFALIVLGGAYDFNYDAELAKWIVDLIGVLGPTFVSRWQKDCREI